MTDVPVSPRTLDEILKAAIKLDNLPYDQQRESLAKEAGVRTATLDAERKKALKESVEDETQTLFLSSAEPCADPVDGVELLDALVAAINKYLVLPDGAPEAMALWTMHTYCHDAAQMSPLIFFMSPTKRCGKTTCMKFLLGVSEKPLLASNCTSATLFRGIEKYKPTLLLDEVDTFLGDDGAMRGVINSGHSRAGALVLRTVSTGDDYDVRPFRTWCPKALAAIGRLPDTLMDRSIVIPIRRKRKEEKTERLGEDNLQELFKSLRQQCARWTADNFAVVKATDPFVPEYLGDREADNWRPLLAIAKVAGWTEATLTAIRQLTPEKAEDDDTSVKLLADIRDIFEKKETEHLLSATIIEALNEMEERPWPGFYRGKGLSTAGMARMLGKYGIKPKMSRSLGNKRGYESRQFTKTWSIYLPAIGDSSATPQQTSNSGASSDFPAATDEPGVAPGNGLEPPSNKECCTVALETGGPQEKSEETPDIAEIQEDAFDDSERLRELEEEYQSTVEGQEDGTEGVLI